MYPFSYNVDNTVTYCWKDEISHDVISPLFYSEEELMKWYNNTALFNYYWHKNNIADPAEE